MFGNLLKGIHLDILEGSIFMSDKYTKKHLFRKLLYHSSTWAITFSFPLPAQHGRSFTPGMCSQNTGLPLPHTPQMQPLLSPWEVQATKPPQGEASDVMPQRLEL